MEVDDGLNLKDIVLKKIETLCLDVVSAISRRESPVFRYSRCSNWNDIEYEASKGLNLLPETPQTQVRFDRAVSVKKFATMLKILKIIYSLIQENRYCTKRDIYYQYPDLYNSQASVDLIIDNIACMLKIPRWELHILATCKGLVAGDIRFEDAKGAVTDCRLTTTGVQIAAHTKDMQNIQTNASFVLVVEKDATFQKLMTCQFCQKMKNVILITGKGFPDNGTRLLLRQIWLEHKLPIFILVDADPHGLEIMAIYKFGSMKQVFENERLTVPSCQWLGLWPEDVKRFHIPESAIARMTDGDRRKALALKKRPYFKDDPYILAQIETMIDLKSKAEIQCLDAISANFLCEVYLPSRIELLLP